VSEPMYESRSSLKKLMVCHPLTVTFRRADAIVSIRCEIYQEVVVLLFEYNARAL